MIGDNFTALSVHADRNILHQTTFLVSLHSSKAIKMSGILLGNLALMVGVCKCNIFFCVSIIDEIKAVVEADIQGCTGTPEPVTPPAALADSK